MAADDQKVHQRRAGRGGMAEVEAVLKELNATFSEHDSFGQERLKVNCMN